MLLTLKHSSPSTQHQHLHPSTPNPHVVGTRSTPLLTRMETIYETSTRVGGVHACSHSRSHITSPAVPAAPAASFAQRHCWNNTWSRSQSHAGTQRGAHFVSDVDLAEAEGAEVRVGLLHRRLDRLVEQFLHKLADVGPHLFHCLTGDRGRRDWILTRNQHNLMLPHTCASLTIWVYIYLKIFQS